AVLPLEVEIPSLRISLQGILDKDAYREARLSQLESLDEARIDAEQRHRVYADRMCQQYNKKVYECDIYEGDLVLRLDSWIDKKTGEGRKFRPKWLGPYRVMKDYGNGAYLLRTLE
ncbi:hypothetical protein KI387_031478, partial [Taxus chinensis]